MAKVKLENLAPKTRDAAPKLAEAYKLGKTILEIATVSSLAPSTVARAIRAMGVEIQPRGVRASGRRRIPFDELKLVEMYLEDMPMAEIARHFGASISTVKARLNETPIERRPVGHRWHQRRLDICMDQVHADRAAGMTIKAIARKHGVAIATIHNRLRSHPGGAPRGE